MRCIYCGGELNGTGDDYLNSVCYLCAYINKREAESLIHRLQGWECPRCHKIHSPFVRECDCIPPVYNVPTTTLGTRTIYIDK